METNKRILITGSATGIGRAIALRLAQDGYDLVLHCNKHRQKAQELAEEIQSRKGVATVVSFDVTDTQQCQEVICEEISAHGAFWGVVSNAGITRDNPLPAIEKEDWFDVINTNLNGFYNVIKPCLMPMIHLRKGGRIVTIASVSGVIGNRGQTNYSASKGGLIAATKSLALELGKRGITVNAVAPGLIDTSMITDEIRERALEMIPLRRIGNANEVAATVSFLCSEDAGYITRQVINVNGGMC